MCALPHSRGQRLAALSSAGLLPQRPCAEHPHCACRTREAGASLPSSRQPTAVAAMRSRTRGQPR
eukprot:3444427-Prymnesium_polylepis.1